MTIRILSVVVLLSLVAVGTGRAEIPPTPPGWQIERAVIVSRHGVRAPEQSKATLDARAATAWPSWPVEPGFLTPRGEELMRLMGGFYRVLYGGRGLVQADNCPGAGTVAAWADVDQRTRVSAAALLAGMYPRCANLSARHQSNLLQPDPLFRPQPSAACPMDPTANRSAVLARMGGGFASLRRAHAPALEMMQSILCPNGATATAAGTGSCGEAVQPDRLEVDSSNRLIVRGPIGFAGVAAENFLLETAENMPKDQVAWGRIGHESVLRELLTVHQATMDLTRRTKPIAQQLGSNLLAHVVATLQDGHNFPGQPRDPEPVRVGYLVGHDVNIVNLAGMLDLDWLVPGFVPGDASPGGALAFELFRDERHGGRRFVRLAYYAQTLDELQRAARLDYRYPPGMMAVRLPACAAEAQGDACPLARFLEIANAAIHRGCVTSAAP